MVENFAWPMPGEEVEPDSPYASAVGLRAGEAITALMAETSPRVSSLLAGMLRTPLSPEEAVTAFLAPPDIKTIADLTAVKEGVATFEPTAFVPIVPIATKLAGFAPDPSIDEEINQYQGSEVAVSSIPNIPLILGATVAIPPLVAGAVVAAPMVAKAAAVMAATKGVVEIRQGAERVFGDPEKVKPVPGFGELEKIMQVTEPTAFGNGEKVKPRNGGAPMPTIKETIQEKWSSGSDLSSLLMTGGKFDWQKLLALGGGAALSFIAGRASAPDLPSGKDVTALTVPDNGGAQAAPAGIRAWTNASRDGQIPANVEFMMLPDGRMASRSLVTGRVKMWRPKKHIVISSDPRLSNLRKLDRTHRRMVKTLRKFKGLVK